MLKKLTVALLALLVMVASKGASATLLASAAIKTQQPNSQSNPTS